MEDAVLGQYIVIQLIDDIGMAIRKAKEKGLSKDIIDKAEAFEDELRMFIPRIDTEDYNEDLRLIESAIEEFSNICEEGNGDMAIEKLKYLQGRLIKMKDKSVRDVNK